MNRLLKSRMVFDGVKYKEVAERMGINERVFRNKLNHQCVNGYIARFTDEQKGWLADRFGIEKNNIE